MNERDKRRELMKKNITKKRSIETIGHAMAQITTLIKNHRV